MSPSSLPPTAPSTAPTYRLLPKQSDFYKSDKRLVSYVGGLGSGKSFVGCLKAIAYMGEHPGSVGLIGAPTYPMLRDATLRTFFDLAPEGFVTDYNKSTMTLRAFNGSEVLFRSCDNPDRLRGPNLSWVYIDEAGYVLDDAWQILKGRIRDPRFPNQAWVTSTPKGRGNFLYREFGQGDDDQHLLVTSSSLENRHLPAGFVDGLGYSGAFYRQEVLGEFTSFDGLVYPGFTRLLVGDPPERPPLRAYVGCDFGYRDPAVLLVLADYGDQQYHLVEEWYYTNRTITDQMAALADLGTRWPLDCTIADPSRPDSIEEMRRAGHRVLEANNDILTGISALTTLLESGRLHVSPSCVKTIEEFETYQWPEPKQQRNSRDRPLDFANHSLDSARYITLYLNHDKGFDVNATTMRAATRQPTAYERFQAMTAQLRQADDEETTDAPDGGTDDVAIGVARGRRGPSLPFHQRFT